uniref:Uncharacterized protein n=1 Tax=Ditylenchus dipsaci TaxID=166011 RepID=A0A915DAA2_9BILA
MAVLVVYGGSSGPVNGSYGGLEALMVVLEALMAAAAVSVYGGNRGGGGLAFTIVVSPVILLVNAQNLACGLSPRIATINATAAAIRASNTTIRASSTAIRSINRSGRAAVTTSTAIRSANKSGRTAVTIATANASFGHLEQIEKGGESTRLIAGDTKCLRRQSKQILTEPKQNAHRENSGRDEFGQSTAETAPKNFSRLQ